MIGKTLDQRYHIIKLLGQGGMAAVYLAEDTQLARKVAVKIPLPHTAQPFAQRFVKEAITLAKMTHEHIVNIYDASIDQNIHFLVMDYVDGVSMDQFLKNKHPLLVRDVLQIILQVCRGLSYMHHEDVIHRDLKPANILLSKLGKVKISDFGLARQLASETNLTKSGELLGSTLYLSPEQSKGEKATKQSDIYSLGIVLYELLTGEPPFDSTEPVTILLKHIQEPLPDPRQINTDIPASLYHVLQKATTKEPTERYQHVMELYAALDRILKSDDIDHVADLRHLFERGEPKYELEPDDTDKNSISEIIEDTAEKPRLTEQKNSADAAGGDHFYTVLIIVTVLGGVLFFLAKRELLLFLWSVQYTFSQEIAFLGEIF
ncbi:protein kinase domain-containing protein [Shimazuella kribbensis]|uniref:protein kinase domain-containing protein n=1 Tax=Shimazuella kribbensis TaxID=139808 RepID=UPI00040D80BB|nr:protein kinase [Shimazuella kribbensis]